jgi:hypothetical protein
MPANWSRRAEVLLRVYPREVGPLAEPVESMLRGAVERPPALSRDAFFAFKYAFLAAETLAQVREEADARGGALDAFAEKRRERAVAEMVRRIEALRAALLA